MADLMEASPDIEVTFKVIRHTAVVDSVDANINKARHVYELKVSVGNHLRIDPLFIRMFKEETELENEKKIMDYDVETDDVIELYDMTP